MSPEIWRREYSRLVQNDSLPPFFLFKCEQLCKTMLSVAFNITWILCFNRRKVSYMQLNRQGRESVYYSFSFPGWDLYYLWNCLLMYCITWENSGETYITPFTVLWTAATGSSTMTDDRFKIFSLPYSCFEHWPPLARVCQLFPLWGEDQGRRLLTY